MLEVTETAQEKLTEYLRDQALDSPIRVYLAQGGCAGSALALALDETRDGDESFQTGGLTFLVARDLFTTLGALKVDFHSLNGRAGFLVSSEKPLPATPSSCGSSCCSC
jgi:iron-sulfur cluster assembly protein